MTYLGQAVTQLDGSPFSHQNCVLAATSELMNCSSLGFWDVGVPRLRGISGDNYGGVTYDTAEVTASRASGGEVKLSHLYWAPETSTNSTLNSLLSAPRIVAISIDAGVTRYTPYNTGTFTGGHTVTVGSKRTVTVYRSDGSSYRQKQALVMDSGHSVAKWVWWPWNLLIKAARARTGSNTINVLYTRDVGHVVRVAKADGAVRTSPKISATNKISKIYKNHSYTVLATLRGGEYNMDGRVLNGWNMIGTNRYVVAKIR